MRTSKAKMMGWSCCAGASGVKSRRVLAAMKRRGGIGEIVRLGLSGFYETGFLVARLKQCP
jgi:hypothetical protein